MTAGSSGAFRKVHQLDGGAIKGAAIREFVRWYAEKEGLDGLQRVLGRMPAALAARLDPSRPALGMLANTWYEAELVHALLDAMVEGLDEQARLELARGGAEAVMSATLKGVYKVLFSWIGTPARYARLSPKVWASYYDCGDFSVEVTEGQSVTSVREWTTHHPVICDLNREAAPHIYRAMGCEGAATKRTHCVALGDDCCRFVTTW